MVSDSKKRRNRLNLKERINIDPEERARVYANLTRMSIKDVWPHYQTLESNSSEKMITKNYLVEQHMDLVVEEAKRVKTKLPDEVSLDDLTSAGVFGLMDAVEGFNLSLGVTFKTYSAFRIKGAILDELRHIDWVPRVVRFRARRVDEKKRAYRSIHGQEPTEEELREELGLSEEQFEKKDYRNPIVEAINMSAQVSVTNSKENKKVDYADTRTTNPFGESEKRNLKEYLTKGLSRAEQLIVILYYYEGMSMKEAGAAMGLSESRVSQMHSSILERLRSTAKIRNLEEELS